MKKIILIVLVAVLVMLAGVGVYSVVGNGDSTSNEPSKQEGVSTPKEQELKGNDLVKAVLGRVKAEIPTVKSTRVVTEDTDGNNLIGKEGEYQYAGSFYDTRTGYEPTNDDFEPIDISDDDYGTTAGGTIEIFKTSADAKKRAELLEGFQTGLINAGPYLVIDNVVLRVSEAYKASEQQEMLTLMKNAL